MTRGGFLAVAAATVAVAGRIQAQVPTGER